jgi:pimeloyl-ACP methyl ester carboxylesterase
VFRRLLAVIAVTGAALAGLSAGAADAQTTTGIGPECAANVRAAVLANAAGPLVTGQIIQYLQITQAGQLQLCTVTVQASEATG